MAARGTDNALWYRERAGGTWGGWGSLGGILKSRPACGESGGHGVKVCAVQGKDDGLYVKTFGRVAFDWVRVDNLNGSPRYLTKSGPALIDMGSAGHSWLLLSLGPEVTQGKRELHYTHYGIGGRKVEWKSLGTVRAAADSDINCGSSQEYGQWFRCAVRTLESDANILSIPKDMSRVNEEILVRPLGRQVLGTPNVTMFIGSDGRWKRMVGIQTTHNMLWMRAD